MEGKALGRLFLSPTSCNFLPSPTLESCSDLARQDAGAVPCTAAGPDQGEGRVLRVPGDFNLARFDHLVNDIGLNLVGCCNKLYVGYAADGYARACGVDAYVTTTTNRRFSVEEKEETNKEFEEKKTELQPKVLEIYEASSVEIKTVMKERKEAGLKKQSVTVNKFLEEVVKIGKSCKITYGTGSIHGFFSQYNVQVSDLVVKGQVFIEKIQEESILPFLISKFDGILGLGFLEISVGHIPPVWIWYTYVPIVFGGVDPKHLKGNHTYVPISRKG